MQAILSTSYFPNIQYISKFISYDNIVIEIHDTYAKQTYRNRCNILSANGVHALSVPVRKNKHTGVKDILIDYSENWQKNHSRAILSAYKNSPFYDYYIDEFEKLFLQKEKYLIDLNNKILRIVFSILEIPINYKHSSAYDFETKSIDYRDVIHPKPSKNRLDPKFKPVEYIQVFSERSKFAENLSILDLIFNEGPLSLSNIEQSIVST